jgi:Fe2+ or Zn2+ uptake regulation protein
MPKEPPRFEAAGTVMARVAEFGGRRTASRQAIVETVIANRRHMTAEEICDLVRQRFPSINLSTVYRTLDVLEKIGVVDHIHLGHGRAVYHLANDTHHHLFCEKCEKVEEIPLSALGPFWAMVEDEFEFQIDRRHFAIVGRCRDCQSP